MHASDWATLKPVLVGLLGMLVLLAIALAAWLKQRRDRRLLSGNAPPGSRVTAQGGYWVEHPRGRYYYRVQPASRYQPSALVVALPVATALHFRVRREGGMERWFKRIGVNREMSIGVERFDAAFYLDASDPEALQRLLQVPEVRVRVERLFAHAYAELDLTGGWLRALFTPAPGAGVIGPALLDPAVETLHMLATLLGEGADGHTPEVDEPPAYAPYAPNGGWTLRRVVAYLIPIVLLVAAPILLAFGIVDYPPLDATPFWHGALLGLPLWLPLLWVSVRLLRGAAYSHTDVLTVGLLLLIATPLLAIALLVGLNGCLDPVAAQRHPLTVAATYYTRSDRSTSYYLQVPSWRTPGALEELSVRRALYEQLAVGDRVEVGIRPGYLGYPWISSVQLPTAGR